MFASLTVRDVALSYGRVTVLDGVDLRVDPGQRVGLVAPNGTGKSTLLHLIAGDLPPDRGSVRLSPPHATVGLLAQEPERRPGESVLAAITRRTGVGQATSVLDATAAALAAGELGADNRYADALERWLDMGGADLDSRIGTVWSELGLAERLLTTDTALLSGGEAARVSLAAILLSRFDLLLLDEPTNDLDLPSLERLERFVVSQRIGLVIVSHDRAFLERTITHVAELDAHSRRVTMFAGGWQSYLDERAMVSRHAQEAYDVNATKRAVIVARGQREREWATEGIAKAKRSAKNRGAKEMDKHIRNAQSESSEQLAGKARRTERMLERLPDVDQPWKPWELRFVVAEVPRGGAVSFRLRDAVVRRGDVTGGGNGSFILGPLNIEIAGGERVAIMGDNGAGKSTLLAALLGRAPLTEGERWMGPGVVVGELDQARQTFSTHATLLRAFIDATGLTVPDARTLLAKFGIGAEHVERKADTLSPGERTRSVLALLMATGVNCLVLDEPTNHLDLAAIEELERALDAFSGTVLLVTHDRRLLDTVRIDRRIRLAQGRVTESANPQ